VVAPGTYAREWEIVSVSEEHEVGPAALQGLVGHVELDPAIPPLGEQLLDQRHQALCGALLQLCKESHACGKVDRAPVVRVDQAIIPQFSPLVKIRDARGGALDEGLRQGVDAAGQCNPSLEAPEVHQKAIACAGHQDLLYEGPHRLLVGRMRIDPACVHLGLPEGLLHTLRDALDKLGLGCASSGVSGHVPTRV
jgi:hypothetical protein